MLIQVEDVDAKFSLLGKSMENNWEDMLKKAPVKKKIIKVSSLCLKEMLYHVYLQTQDLKIFIIQFTTCYVEFTTGYIVSL